MKRGAICQVSCAQSESSVTSVAVLMAGELPSQRYFLSVRTVMSSAGGAPWGLAPVKFPYTAPDVIKFYLGTGSVNAATALDFFMTYMENC